MPLADGFKARTVLPPSSAVSHVVAGKQAVVTAGPGPRLTVIDLAGGEPTALGEAGDRVQKTSALAISSDDRWLAVAYIDRAGGAVIDIWDLTNKSRVRTISGHANAVQHLLFLAQDRLVSGSDDGLLCIWDCNQADLATKR